MVGGEKEKRSPENRFETQRSGKVNPGEAGRESPLEGFKSERRSSGVSELSCEHGSERYEACDDDAGL